MHRFGDVDLDGKDDILVRVDSFEFPGLTAPEIRVHSGATLAPLLVIPMPPGAGGFGDYDGVVAIGDVDADGVPDLAAGSHAEKTSVAGTLGVVRVYSGAQASLVFAAANPGIGNVGFGQVVSPAGDVDADGNADFAVSTWNDWPSPPGEAYVFSGAGGQVLRVYSGLAATSSFGAAMDVAGDVDLDGFVDLLVTEPSFIAPTLGLKVGAAHVFSGQSGQRIRLNSGLPDGSAFGGVARGLGDVDADGVSDFGCLSNSAVESKVHVFSGATGGALHRFGGFGGVGMYALDRLGDVDQDGADDFLLHANALVSAHGSGIVAGYSGATGARIMVLFDTDLDDWGGMLLPENLGDVDGDGQDEVGVTIQDITAPSPLALHVYSPLGPLVAPYGVGCPGTGGISPVLSATFVSGGVQIRVQGGLGGAAVALLIGGLPKATPIAGNSCSLLVTDTWPVVPIFGSSGAGPGAGSVSVLAPWPAGVGYVFLQALVADSGTARGYSASNGLELGRH